MKKSEVRTVNEEFFFLVIMLHFYYIFISFQFYFLCVGILKISFYSAPYNEQQSRVTAMEGRKKKKLICNRHLPINNVEE